MTEAMLHAPLFAVAILPQTAVTLLGMVSCSVEPYYLRYVYDVFAVSFIIG